MQLSINQKVLDLNMQKIFICLGTVLMMISCATDGIVIADAWDDFEEVNEKIKN